MQFREVGILSKNVVELVNELLHCWHEFHETFGDKDNTIVSSLSGASSNHLCDVVNHIVEIHALCSNFLTNHAVVRLSLKCTFESDM